MIGESDYELFVLSRDGHRFAKMGAESGEIKKEYISFSDLICDAIKYMRDAIINSPDL